MDSAVSLFHFIDLLNVPAIADGNGNESAGNENREKCVCLNTCLTGGG